MNGSPYAVTNEIIAEELSNKPEVPAMSRLRRALVTLVVLSQVVACPSLVWACTGITIKPKDGSIIFARTLEFAVDIKLNIIVVPRGKEYVGTAPGDKPGLRVCPIRGTIGV